MTACVVLIRTSRRLPGLLTGAGWAALGSGPVYASAETGTSYRESEALRSRASLGFEPHPLSAPPGTPESEGVPSRAAEPGVPPVTLLAGSPAVLAEALVTAAAASGTAVWLSGSDGDPELVAALGDRVRVELVTGSADPPGSGLLDVVAVMDRLRSPGGCPWDAEQTHDSLRRYLLEETYEAYDALVDGDFEALREELGDVLLQVVFHARLAQEAEPSPWSIDDVAAGLLAKLVRRHPHVFADRAVDGAAEVAANWEQIKRAEKGRTSVVDGLARSQPALALAQALVRRAGAAGLPLPTSASPTGPAAAALVDAADLGEELLAAVVRAQAAGLDAEAELRAAADRYAAVLRAAEHAAAPPPRRS